MIHVCYALYDKDGRFSKNLGTSMLSLFENTQEWVTIHLLHDHTLTEENREKFIALVRRYGNHICFYDMEEQVGPIMKKITKKGKTSRYSPAAFYRLLAMRVLPISVPRIIYLDGDTICNLDIRDLWEEPVGSNGFASVSEQALTYDHMVDKAIIHDGFVERSRYFCSGVLLIDMTAYRKWPDLAEKGLAMLKTHPAYSCYDQDILNYYFSKGYRQLPIRYDLFADAERLMGHTELIPAIYHYAGAAIDAYRGDIYDQLWTKYYIKTPWYDSALFHDICRIAASSTAGAIQSFWRFLRGRTLTIVGRDADLSRLQNLLNPQQGDRFFRLYSDPHHINLPGLLKDMAERLKGNPASKDIYLFFSPHYAMIRPKIIEAGYQEGKDFLDVMWIMALEAGQYPGGRDMWRKV